MRLGFLYVTVIKDRLVLHLAKEVCDRSGVGKVVQGYCMTEVRSWCVGLCLLCLIGEAGANRPVVEFCLGQPHESSLALGENR